MRLRQPKTLITGKPGVGKTTLMRRLVVRMKPVDMRGFYTTEIRSRGQRVGYGAAMGVDHTRRNSLIRLLKGLAVAWAALPGTRRPVWAKQNRIKQEVGMKLPSPNIDGPVSVEHAIHQRRTRRSFTSRALHPDQLSQLLWAAGGITGRRGVKRAAPSAGALYPMDLYVVVGQGGVTSIEAGIYHYEPGGHRLFPVASGDQRAPVARACLSQMWMADAPLTLVITAEYARARAKYGRRGNRYAMIEAGHIGQNIFLQAQALGLGAGIVGAFHDGTLIDVMQIPSTHEPLSLMPVGHQG